MSAVLLGFVPGIVTGLLNEGLFRAAETARFQINNKYKIDVTKLLGTWKASIGSDYTIPDFLPTDPKEWLECPHKDKCSSSANQTSSCYTDRKRIHDRYKKFHKDLSTLPIKHFSSALVTIVGTIAMSILFAPAALNRTTYSYYAYITLSVTSSLVGVLAVAKMHSKK